MVKIFLVSAAIALAMGIQAASNGELPTPTPTPTKPTLVQEQKVLNQGSHVYQTFNNCGPASLSMALSYAGITANQTELGQSLRPVRNSVYTYRT